MVVKILSHNKLPDELKEEYPIIYCEWDNFLVVFHNKEIIFHESDRMEPEDVSFYRNLNWIPLLLEKVYLLGKEEG